MHHTSEAELLYDIYDSLSVAIELMYIRLRHISRKLFTTGGGTRRSLSDFFGYVEVCRVFSTR